MSKLPKWLVVMPLITVMQLLQPLSAAPAPPPASGSGDYEIPLSDLKKVEKKKPKKSGKGHREKSKESSAPDATPAASGASAGQPASASMETGKGLTPTPQAVLRDATAEVARIVHEPNSYVVAGKRTVITAFVSGSEQIQSVRCQFRSAEEGGYGLVPMTREEGRLYTFSALLPAIDQREQSLRYRIVAVDSSGKEAYSREFVVPVKPTSVVPGWQQEPSRELINVELANPEKPLTGFVDVLVRGSRKQ